MPAYSKKFKPRPNLIKEKDRLPLPRKLVYTDITINYSFQSFPTVAVKAEGIPEENFEEVKKAYKLGRLVTLFGMQFEVAQFGWSRDRFTYQGQEYNFYSITVNYDPIIKRRLEAGIKSKNVSGGLAFSSILNDPLIKNNELFSGTILGILRAKGTLSLFSQGAESGSGKKNKNTKPPKISLQKLCESVGVNYSGPEVLIQIPEDEEESIDIVSLIQEAARSKGCYIEYGKGDCVYLTPWVAPRKQWKIETREIFEDGENTETFPPIYVGAELNWDREDEKVGEEEEEDDSGDPTPIEEEQQLPPRYNFVRVQSNIQTLTEQDVDFDKPPKDTKVLRDMSSLFWESGPTRQFKRTVLYDGTEVKSELAIKGFSYQAKDIAQEDGLLFSNEPAKYWRTCEQNQTTRIYEPIGFINLKVAGINKANQKNTRLVIHPDYANLGKITTYAADGYLFSFQPKVEYLTTINSTGYKLMPLEKEPGSGQDLSDVIDPKENPRAKVQVPVEIPKEDRTAYKLASARSYYRQEDQNQNLPFQIEFFTHQELPRHLKEAIKWEMDIAPKGPDDLIGIVTPDLNYVEPLVVLTESRTTNSFLYAADPDSTEDNPIKPLITGEEGYFRLDRTILGIDRYRENITEYTATDPGYKACLTISRTAEKSGQVPQAESRPIKYDKTENQDYWNKRKYYQYTFTVPFDKKQKLKNPLPRYFVDSDRKSEGIASSGNLSFPYAKSKAEALKAAKVALEMEHCQSAINHNKSISWFFPEMRDGHRVVIDSEKFRILSLSVSIEQIGRGVVKPVKEFAQLTPGSKVVLGFEEPRKVTSYKVDEAIDEDPMEEAFDPNQGSVPAGDGETQAKFLGGETELGDVLDPDSTRRKF